MTREQKLKDMREIVRDLGEETKWTDENGHEQKMYELMVLGVLLDENDVYTSVSIDHYGQLNIGGYDGIDTGWDDDASKRTDEEIDRLYEEMLDMAKAGKDNERYETIERAKKFLEEVGAIVENELDGFCTIRYWQERMRGQVWSEGVTVDIDYEEGQGTFLDTRTISYGVRSQEEKVAFLRYESTDGQSMTNMPFHGSVQEAADYLMEPFRKCFNEDEN